MRAPWRVKFGILAWRYSFVKAGSMAVVDFQKELAEGVVNEPEGLTILRHLVTDVQKDFLDFNFIPFFILDALRGKLQKGIAPNDLKKYICEAKWLFSMMYKRNPSLLKKGGPQGENLVVYANSLATEYQDVALLVRYVRSLVVRHSATD